jgi:hypothetical protein
MPAAAVERAASLKKRRRGEDGRFWSMEFPLVGSGMRRQFAGKT